MANPLWNDTVIRTRAVLSVPVGEEADREFYGAKKVWTTPSTLILNPCQIRPSEPTEGANNRLVERYSLHFEYGYDVIEGDEIEWMDALNRTLILKVIGRPVPKPGLSELTQHTYALLEVFDG